MDDSTQAVLNQKSGKTSFLRKLGNFMLYGGWMLVLVLFLILMIVFSRQ